MRAPNLDEEELQLVYHWVDSIPLSRPKKNIARDFSDCGIEGDRPWQWYSANGWDNALLRA